MRPPSPPAGALIAALVSLAACGPNAVTVEEFNTREVRLPDGARIRAEVMMHRDDVMRGMMFRDSLAADRGMLFIHGSPGRYPYWMYQVRIPLDILWLDEARRIVEMSPDTPPCRTGPKECPSYGGKQTALMVLELAGGSIGRHQLKLGDTVGFF